jgi:parallel beta-helix repeat protein
MHKRRWVHAGIVLFLLALLVTLLQSVSTAESARPTAWQVVGQIGGPTSAVAVQGDYAYVGVGLRLIVLDVTNPVTPTEVGSTTPFPYFVEDIAVSGARAYVAAGGAGLRVVDISDPANPTELGAWDSPGYAEGIAVSGDIVYLADGPYGLRMVDVSDPTHPTPLGSAFDANYAFAVTVADHRAYLAAGGAGLLIADVSDPAQPRELGTLDTPGYAYNLTVSDSLAYVADGWGGLQIVDVTDPAQPARKAALALPGQAFGVVVAGTRAYVAAAYEGLRVVDVTDPTQPSEIGAAPMYRGHAADVAGAGETALVADCYVGLRIYDVSLPAHPNQIGAFDTFIYAEGLVVANDYAYVNTLTGGLWIIDLSSPVAPRIVGHVNPQPPLDPDFSEVEVQGGWAYVGTWQGFIHVIDVSDLARPDQVTVFQAIGEFNGMAIQGDILYVTGQAGPVQLIDIHNPAQPALLGAVNVPYAEEVAVSGERAYLAVDGSLADGGGLTIVDVRDPHAPAVIGHYGIIAGRDVAVVGNLAYLSTTDSLNIIDVSDPTHPVNLGAVATPGYARKLFVEGDTAYVGDAMRGVAVVDVSDPHTPRLVSSIPTPGYAEEVIVSGGKAYVADATGGLVILAPAAAATAPGPGPALLDDRAAGGLLAPADGTPQAAVVALTRAASVPHAPHPWSGRLATAEDRIPAAKRDGPTKPNAAECVVTSAADAGPGTLRACLASAGQGSHITFAPSVFPPTHPVTITVLSPLPPLDQGHVTLDASDNWAVLDGAQAPTDTVGLVIVSDDNVVQGLHMVRFPASGIYIGSGAGNRIGGDRSLGQGPLGQGNLVSRNGYAGISLGGAEVTGNTVAGNFVGVDVSGARAAPNRWGITVGGAAHDNTIGSLVPGQGNVISGNGEHEVMMNAAGTTGNILTGNLIGVDASGEMVLRTREQAGDSLCGVIVHSGASDNQIGPGNVIGGVQTGVLMIGDGVRGNVVTGNLIGTNAAGAALSVYGNAVELNSGAQGNTIGPGNRITFNGGGVLVYGTGTTGNTITANAISDNDTAAIVLADGGNVGMVAPSLAEVTTTTVSGSAAPGARVEVFSDWGDSSALYEGSVTALPSGAFSFSQPSGLTGPRLTATATDTDGNTSQLSAPISLSNRVRRTLTVTCTADAGPGTLRQMLLDAGSGDLISFDPAVFQPAAPVTIAPHSALPLLTRGYVTIDGSDAGVILDGANLGGTGNGLEIVSNGNIVRGLQIIRFPESGVRIMAHDNVIGGDRSQGAGPTGQGNVLSGNAGCGVNMGQSTANVVIGNLIGTDATGTQAFGNGSLGIFMNVDSTCNRIGGLDPRDRNIISGNTLAGMSMMMGSTDNRILGNYIGTDVTGTRAVGNGMFGVSMELGAFGNLVQGNLISSNHHFGIYIGDFGSDYNTVIGNLIGIDVTGTQAMANLPAAIGIGGREMGGFYNRIGGTGAGERNVISGENIGLHLNGVPGDQNLVLGNYIGADITGTRATANWYSVAVGLVHGGRYFVGGTTPAEGNLIGGTVGTALRIESDHNYVAGNRIGTDASGAGALVGGGLGGITILAQHNTIQGNRIAFSAGAGIEVTTYAYNTLRRNAIYDSAGPGIVLREGGNLLLSAPVITAVAPESVTGTACPGCTVEVFSDDEDEGRIYEGTAIADAVGHFSFDKGSLLAGPYLTATATDGQGNTSEFSASVARLAQLYLPLVLKSH